MIINILIWSLFKILLKLILQSRSKHEDPEQLKLKQKAKEVSLWFIIIPYTVFRLSQAFSIL